jgi:hypothetical protein
MLGFDALGRLALGQLSGNFYLTAETGSFALTGIATAFTATLPSAAAAFVETGNDATLIDNSSASPTMVAATGSYVLTGNAVAPPPPPVVVADVFGEILFVRAEATTMPLKAENRIAFVPENRQIELAPAPARSDVEPRRRR